MPTLPTNDLKNSPGTSIATPPVSVVPATLQWARSSNGIISGVCALFARRMKLGVSGVRFIWALTVLLFGSGLVSYFSLAVSLPLEGDPEKAYRSRCLGVCRRIAIRTGHEIGLIRLLATLSLIVSAGLTLVLYFVIAVLLPKEAKSVERGF